MGQIRAVPILAPSVLAADFARLEQDIASAEQAGVTFYHLDIMDGHFVPNISFGPAVVGTIDRLTKGYLDVHLMLSEPERYFEPFVKNGADSITFHIEVHPKPKVHADRLHVLGVHAGISLNPDTAIETVLPHLEQFEYLLIMSVHPGFGGQAFMPSALPKVKTAREFIDRRGLNTKIQVDGGVDLGNARTLVDHGADILVMGTAFFGKPNRREIVDSVRSLNRRGAV